MGLKVTNNAFGTLNAGISNSDTIIVLEAGQGARFPVLGAGDYFYATLIDTSNNLEIVKVTARATDTMTVVRAQDGTTARAYNVNDRFELRPTAALFNEKADAADLALKQDAATAVTKDSPTGAALMPVGTTAQRPASPAAGMYRLNTTTGEPEWYDTGSGQWVVFRNAPTYQVEYLVVAGGGGGGAKRGGGGGAGGYISESTTVTTGSTYSLTIGAGGSGSTAGSNNATNGGNSTGFGQTSIGGGRGAGYASTDLANGASGGSGGGGARGEASSPTGSGGSGTAGQGNAGGNSNSSFTNGAGGGGAGAAGASVTSATGGAGGNGLNWQSLGTFYAGGGGGGGALATDAGGAGGNGGGGYGGGASPSPSVNGTAGTANRGGGGGGAGDNPAWVGGNGGSGIVIIRYAGTPRGTGGTITQSGGFTIHTFTSSGTFTA